MNETWKEAKEAIATGDQRAEITNYRQAIIRGFSVAFVVMTLIAGFGRWWLRTLTAVGFWIIYSLVAANTRLGKHL